MTRLDHPDYLDHIRRSSRRFRDVLATCDPAARVPACPDWDAGDLLWHLTEVQWFWTQVIAARPAAPDEEAPGPERPGDHAGLLAFFDETSAGLVAALEAADPAEPAWSWSDDQTVGFTYRRQAHEALIHRLDAEQAAGDESPLDPRLAADGVAELVDVMYGGEPPAWGRFEPGEGEVDVELTDVEVVLRVRPGMFHGTDPDSGESHDGPHLLLLDAAEQAGGAAAATVRGTAADVDAWLWKRRDDGAVTWSGDPGVRERFLAAVRPPLT
ncbi:maleylpyruvate isomerase family mycothiol-dependent enzyme [Nocardioides sp. TF02-7]|uniref:maleylpyruvate isomerase family mycothiol-dependent enzyme n=1 Tax=Nocardioides sp. TF02-7 TaxID=2917724 RepID=UPI001F058D86|nr:maleylpyruvate isomerase family mycothiol-dependent enzyme [Nocardioides sp. TF02-7]UMG92596.1 maleylpyruvate isomerase family mycothiol-dependent enzyme [Nocardioides sp. TF02-7]